MSAIALPTRRLTDLDTQALAEICRRLTTGGLLSLFYAGDKRFNAKVKQSVDEIVCLRVQYMGEQVAFPKLPIKCVHLRSFHLSCNKSASRIRFITPDSPIFPPSLKRLTLGSINLVGRVFNHLPSTLEYLKLCSVAIDYQNKRYPAQTPLLPNLYKLQLDDVLVTREDGEVKNWLASLVMSAPSLVSFKYYNGWLNANINAAFVAAVMAALSNTVERLRVQPDFLCKMTRWPPNLSYLHTSCISYFGKTEMLLSSFPDSLTDLNVQLHTPTQAVDLLLTLGFAPPTLRRLTVATDHYCDEMFEVLPRFTQLEYFHYTFSTVDWAMVADVQRDSSVNAFCIPKSVTTTSGNLARLPSMWSRIPPNVEFVNVWDGYPLFDCDVHADFASFAPRRIRQLTVRSELITRDLYLPAPLVDSSYLYMLDFIINFRVDPTWTVNLAKLIPPLVTELDVCFRHHFDYLPSFVGCSARFLSTLSLTFFSEQFTPQLFTELVTHHLPPSLRTLSVSITPRDSGTKIDTNWKTLSLSIIPRHVMCLTLILRHATLSPLVLMDGTSPHLQRLWIDACWFEPAFIGDAWTHFPPTLSKATIRTAFPGSVSIDKQVRSYWRKRGVKISAY